MEKILEFFLQIMRKTAIPFMICSIFLNTIGYLTGNEIMNVSSLYELQGITYEGIFQLLFLSLLVGFINTMFDMKNFMKKILPLYKNILRIILIFAITIYFAWYYRWFAMNNTYAWLSFILTFSLCIIISIFLNIYLTHKKNKEYEMLLKKYKERGQNHESNSN